MGLQSKVRTVTGDSRVNKQGVPTSYLWESGGMLLWGAVDKIFGELIKCAAQALLYMRDAHLAIANREY